MWMQNCSIQRLNSPSAVKNYQYKLFGFVIHFFTGGPGILKDASNARQKGSRPWTKQNRPEMPACVLTVNNCPLISNSFKKAKNGIIDMKLIHADLHKGML